MDKHKRFDSPRTLWDQFQRTGSINVYMAYRNALARQREKEEEE